MTIQEQIKQRIDEAEPGTVFFVNDFAEFDNEYVSKLLSTMKGFGVLERLAKGIYYKPIVTNYGNVYPSAEKIVKLTIGNKKIRLKHRSPSTYSYHSKLMPLLVLALKAKGQSNITSADTNRIEKLISDSTEKQQIKTDLATAPVWVRKYIKPIIEKYEHLAR